MLGESCHPGNFVARFWEDVAVFDHVARWEIDEIDPDIAGVTLRGGDEAIAEGKEQALTVGCAATGADLALQVELATHQGLASDEVVSVGHFVDDDLGKKRGGTGD